MTRVECKGASPRERSDHIEWPLQIVLFQCSPNNENNSVKRKGKDK